MSGFQQSSSNSVTTDSCFTNIEKTLNEISNMVNNHQIDANHDPNNCEMKHDFTRFCSYCKKTDHTVKFCWSLKRKKLNEEEKAPPQPKKTYSQNYPNQQKSPNNYKSNSNDRSNAQGGRSDSAYVANRNRSRSDSCSGAIRFEARPDKVNIRYDTLQSCNPLSKSSLRTKKVRIQLTLLTPANIFKLNYSNTPSETQIKIMAIARSF